jgi:hypothetical protein
VNPSRIRRTRRAYLQVYTRKMGGKRQARTLVASRRADKPVVTVWGRLGDPQPYTSVQASVSRGPGNDGK